jgi:GPH family glycoside/pentoside/hexuronide:cation symporter
MAIEEDLSEWEIAPTGKMFSYGLGYVIVNYFLYYGLANLFYYYQVELGISVILVGIAFVIFALWNMINDPILGYLTERPTRWTKKWGFRAPWVVISAIPLIILYFLIWVPPTGADLMTIFLWFIIITCLFDTFFSLFNDHVYGGYTNQFPSEYERRRSFAIATLCIAFGVIGMGALSGAFITPGDPSSYVLMALIACIIMGVLCIFLFLGIKESKEMKQMYLDSYEKSEEVGFFSTMKTALKTKNFLVSLAGYTCQVTAVNLFLASQLYLFNYVYNLDFTYFLYAQVIGVVAILVLIPFWSNFARRYGFKKTYWVCFAGHGLTFLLFIFVISVPLLLIFTFINYAFLSGEILMLQPVASDTYDEVSVKFDKHVDATLVGVRTFFFRIAFLVQAGVFVAVFLATGFVAEAGATQTELALWGIRFNGIILPAAIFVGMALIFRKYYTLEGAEKEALIKKLKDKGIFQH